MTKSSLSDYKGGWFLGNFEPHIEETNDVEIGVLQWGQYQYLGGYVRDCPESIIVLNGKVISFDDMREHEKGTIFFIQTGEQRKLLTVTDCEFLHIKYVKLGCGKGRNTDISLEMFENLYKTVCGYVCDRDYVEKIKSLPIRINSKEISVVVQGAVHPLYTSVCLESIRKYLPDSQIVLSTWKGENIAHLDYDELVLNDDVGELDGYLYMGNINRQVKSTLQGIKGVKTKYTLKLRSDAILTGCDFIRFFDAYQKRMKKFSYFSKRVVVSDYAFRNLDGHKSPYFVRDFWYFGLTDDLKSFFEKIPFFDEELIKTLFQKDYRKRLRFAPEQVMTIAAFSTIFSDVKFEDMYNPNIMDKSDCYIVNNFIPIGLFQSSIISSGKYYNDLFVNNGISFKYTDIFSFDYFTTLYQTIDTEE